MMQRVAQWFSRAIRRQNGNATVEFVLAVPVLMTVFLASFESGLLMTRQIILDQALDRTMRELRLGRLDNPSADSIRTEICNRAYTFADCENNLSVELIPVDSSSWRMPSTITQCVDRDNDVTPVVEFTQGGENQMMLVRACVIQNALFPSMGIGQALSQDAEGGYALVAVSAFVNEPA